MRFRVAILALFVSATFVGCGSRDVGAQRASMAGKVSWKGSPLAKGHITFQPEKGPTAMGPITNGEYQINGVPVGKCSVSIEGFEEGPEVAVSPTRKEKSSVQILPAEYNKKSTLQTTVGEGSNTADFKLE